MASRKTAKQMRELAQLAYERDLSRCVDVLYAQMNEWKDEKMSVWDIVQSIHEFHDKIARGLYRSYVTSDQLLAVAFGVAQGVISINDVPVEERARVREISGEIYSSL